MTYGAVPGGRSYDLMNQAEYRELFGEDGNLPEKLRDAIDKYALRLQTQQAEQSSKLTDLLEFLADKTLKN